MTRKEQRRIANCPFGIHEALHTAHVAICMFDEHVADHPAVSTRPGLREQAAEITRKMADLYQAIGRVSGERTKAA